VLRDPDDVVAELLRERPRHDDILPGQPSRLAMFDVTSSYIRPQVTQLAQAYTAASGDPTDLADALSTS
ncbi:hypothetical protein, partial [Microbacterium nanhaiense]|uniref:hypothetical protein n=1 Tax=Microbacterium nanhaiense TaxID=1301026 RepID=UPI001E61B96F